jgi:hypothetical protein
MHHVNEKLKEFPIEPISKLASGSALILSIVLVVLFLVKLFVFERLLLKTVYKSVYHRLNEGDRRSFINHHVAGATKLITLLVAMYPFVAVISDRANFKSHASKNSLVSMGDILIVATQMLIGAYIFELIYRSKPSIITTLHHIGTITIGETAIVLTIWQSVERDADLEYLLCLVWGMFGVHFPPSLHSSCSSTSHNAFTNYVPHMTGAFDTFVELLPHLALILYRVYPERHHFLRNLFLSTGFVIFLGATLETIIIALLFGSLWDEWRLAFKIMTPIIHLLFCASQLYGSAIFWRMYKRQQQQIHKEESNLNRG